MVVVYKKRNFTMYSYDDGYIIRNMNKDFDIGHTHIKNYKTAKYIINMALYKKIPKEQVSDYIIESIERISIDKKYINKLEYFKKKGIRL